MAEITRDNSLEYILRYARKEFSKENAPKKVSIYKINHSTIQSTYVLTDEALNVFNNRTELIFSGDKRTFNKLLKFGLQTGLEKLYDLLSSNFEDVLFAQQKKLKDVEQLISDSVKQLTLTTDIISKLDIEKLGKKGLLKV